MTLERYEQFIRWYPPQWRARYGDEMTALLEDTYSTAGEVPLRQRVALFRSGLAERARAAGMVGLSQEPDLRVRGGALLVLCGWALCLVATAMFVKAADRWSTSISTRNHVVAGAGFNVVSIAAAIGCLLVLLAAVIVLPAFVRLLRRGGWVEVRRRILLAVGAVLTSAVLFVVLAVWAHSSSSYDRNGGDAAYAWFFVFVAVVFLAAIGCATAAAVSVARRVELSHGRVRTLGYLAIGVVGLMALALLSLVTWWVPEAVHAPGFLSQSIGNGLPYSSSVAPPVLVAAGLLMTAGLALGVAGVVRIVGSLGPGGQVLT